MAERTRWLKWIGMPPVLQSDGWSVHRWDYENSRRFPMVMPGNTKGRTRHVMERGTHKNHLGESFTLSREYTWTQDHNQFVTEVSFTDAIALMSLCPIEFVDVTDMPRDKWPSVKHEPIIKNDPPARSPASPRPKLFVPRRSAVR